MSRRSIARTPIWHYGEQVQPYEVELPEQDMRLDHLLATDKPCERCWFVPVPDGKCMCQEES